MVLTGTLAMRGSDAHYKVRKAGFLIRPVQSEDQIPSDYTGRETLLRDFRAGKPVFTVNRPGHLPELVRLEDLHGYRPRCSRRSEKLKRAVAQYTQTKVRATVRALIAHEKYELLHTTRPPSLIKDRKWNCGPRGPRRAWHYE